MATESEHHGTKRDERGGIVKVWKRISVRFNLITFALFSFFTLILIKIILSGIFLQFEPLTLTSSSLALADETMDNEEPDQRTIELMLRKKEKELNEKEMELKKMEERLLPLKEEVEARIAELDELQASLTAYSKDLAERELSLKDARIDHLVKLYSSMEADKAANIMDKLPVETVVRIMGNMNGKAAGQILAVMPPEKGAQISQKLSKVE